MESTARLELHALEKMIGARCSQIERSVKTALAAGALASRESELQYQVFAERSSRARDQLKVDSTEPIETRVARLERFLEALDCSWAYFGAGEGSSMIGEADKDWEIRIK